MSALQDIALDMEAQAAAPAPAPATPASRWQRWFAQLSIGGKITAFFCINLGFALARQFMLQGLDDRCCNARLASAREFAGKLPSPGITDVKRGGHINLPLRFCHCVMHTT